LGNSSAISNSGTTITEAEQRVLYPEMDLSRTTHEGCFVGNNDHHQQRNPSGCFRMNPDSTIRQQVFRRPSLK